MLLTVHNTVFKMDKEDTVLCSGETSQEEKDSQTEAETEAETQPRPEPQYAVFQKVLAKDNTTPLIYEAVVRKLVYAPNSRKVNIYLVDSPDECLDATLDTIYGQEPSYSWHYFVHYAGWKAKWDRWVDEEQIFPDNEESRILAKRLKTESKCLKKGSTQKKVMEVMQRIVRLEQELRDKQARGESIDIDNADADADAGANTKMNTCKDTSQPEQKKNSNAKEGVTKTFLAREVGLRKQDLTSRNCSINLPFPLKKVLTDDWEIITKCEMLHSLPASVSVMDALNAYYEGKMKVLNANPNTNANANADSDTGVNGAPSDKEEEKKDDEIKIDGSVNASVDLDVEMSENSSDNDDEETIEKKKNQQEWKEMVEGICLFFDQALPKRLLFRHEIPQCVLLEENHEKRYCELYPCEYLIRMCIKLPDLLEDAKHIPEEEKSRILFKIGDLLRFLNRYQDDYFLQRYRKATNEESAKAMKLKKRLGLDSEDTKDDEADSDHNATSNDEFAEKIEKGGNANRKRASNSKGGATQRRKNA